MNSKLIFASLVAMGLIVGNAHQGHTAEGDNRGTDKGMTQQEAEGESKAVEVGNKICPVSGDKILAPGETGAMGETVKYEYKGKIYNLCCEMCVKDFKKDPEKYSKIADEETKEIQTDPHKDHNHNNS